MDPKISKIMSGGDTFAAYNRLGIDAFPIRVSYYCQGLVSGASLTMNFPEKDVTGGGIFAGWNGPDEFGRIWFRGAYVGGDVKTWKDLEKYTPAEDWEKRCPPDLVRQAKAKYPDKAFGCHVHLGPFENAMESMGFLDFFMGLHRNRDFIREIIRRRTDWIINCFQYVESLGADYIVMGDDVAYKNNTFVSPKDLDELAFPYYRRIVSSVKIPVIWHSDGYVERLVGKAIDTGFKGLHPIEENGGNHLGKIKENYGQQIALIGNVNALTVLTKPDLAAVRADVDRCMDQAKAHGGYILATSNSAHFATCPEAISEMYSYGKKVSWY